jgi:hypothetical protein
MLGRNRARDRARARRTEALLGRLCGMAAKPPPRALLAAKAAALRQKAGGWRHCWTLRNHEMRPLLRAPAVSRVPPLQVPAAASLPGVNSAAVGPPGHRPANWIARTRPRPNRARL